MVTEMFQQKIVFRIYSSRKEILHHSLILSGGIDFLKKDILSYFSFIISCLNYQIISMKEFTIKKI